MQKGTGRKLTLALKAAASTSKEAGNLLSIMEKLSDRQRKVFLQLSKGKDELQALVDAGMIHEIEGVAKKVYLQSGKGRMVKNLTSEDIDPYGPDPLDDASYERLLRLSKSVIAVMAGTADYRDYLVDITDFFKAIAPEAFAVVAEIMAGHKEKVPAGVRLKAAFGLLDRGGYTQATQDQGNEMPVKVVLNMDAVPKVQKVDVRVVETVDVEDLRDKETADGTK